MNDMKSTTLYQHEDEFISTRIGKPGSNSGAFLAFDADIQFGFIEDQYSEDLYPLLEAVAQETKKGKFEFHACSVSSNYRLRCYGLMIVINKQIGIALQTHANEILSLLNQ